jgi:hypothetical protein
MTEPVARKAGCVPGQAADLAGHPGGSNQPLSPWFGPISVSTAPSRTRWNPAAGDATAPAFLATVSVFARERAQLRNEVARLHQENAQMRQWLGDRGTQFLPATLPPNNP